ncbi:MAG: MOSC domain-containing protein [Chloroflexota bacterium]|jgi:hypothetical protein
MAKEYREIGKVTGLYRYPVKSMRGEAVESTKIGWHGLQGDRRFAFLRLTNKTGLPWLSVRQLPKLILYSPRFESPDDLEESAVVVKTPQGMELPLDSNELISELQELCNFKLSLVRLWRGTFDSMPISLISTNSVNLIASHTGRSLEMDRFRPNIVTDFFEAKAYPEDKIIGESLVFGNRDNSARIRLFRKDPRCMVVNLDPKTAVQDPIVLREVVKNHKNFLGVYGGVERPGTIQFGDSVYMVV